MGFCRRCGEIVAGERCRCGGLPVDPIVAFRKHDSTTEPNAQDKWSKTYASSKGSVSPARSTTPFQPSQDATVPPRLNRSMSSSPTKQFPRPISSSSSLSDVSVGSRVTDYIATTTSGSRSPLKHAITGPNPEAGILPSLTPNDTTLSKVYGSVLQPKETLATFSCALCATAFPPDATIYPDPLEPASSHRFLCRPCFVESGGSKGPCGTCTRPVLTLKSEGGFIHAADKYWHKRCFNCAGCFKNIGDSPMVDLLGHPCCPSCFDNCLKRETPKKVPHADSPKPESLNKPGALGKVSQGSRSRESSPVIGELERRLGVARKREGSPALEELSQRLNGIGKDINSRYPGDSPSSSPTLNRSRNSRGSGREDGDRLSPSTSNSPTKPSPIRRQKTGSPAPTPEAVEEMKQRLLKATSHTSSPTRTNLFPSFHSLSSKDRILSLQSSSTMSDIDSTSPGIPLMPDLVSDFSDTMTQSSLSCSEPDSPPRALEDDVFNSSQPFGNGYGSRHRRNDYFNPLEDAIAEETNSQLNTPTKAPTRTPDKSPKNNTPVKNTVTTSSPLQKKPSKHSIRQTGTKSSDVKTLPSLCAKCQGKLFTMGNGGSYITAPSDKDGSLRRYHTQCFTCDICDGMFEKASNGQASFVKHRGNACHPECAPKERIMIHKSPSSPALRTKPSTSPIRPTPSPTPTPSKPVTSSRFEQSTITASPSSEGPLPRFGGRNACPGCKKAVSPMERGVIPGPQGTKWHSSCLVCGGKKTRPISWYGRDPAEKDKPGCGKKLDSAAKSDGDGGVWCRECILLLGIQSSPQPSPSRTPLSPTYTGSGKMVPQFTGTTTIARQFTGLGSGDGALLRQLTGGGLSPTRSISPTKQLGVRPRPKSVIRMRSSKSVDEGRGMSLVRQLTGASNTGWND